MASPGTACLLNVLKRRKSQTCECFFLSMTLFSLIDLVWVGWSEGKLWLCGPRDRSVQTVNNEEEMGRVVP